MITELEVLNKKEELYDLFNKIKVSNYISTYNPELSIIKGINYDLNDKNLESKILSSLDDIESHNYYNPKSFENSKIYEYLGVKKAKKLVTSLFKKKTLNGNNYYLDSNRTIDSLINFEKMTRFNEKVHLFSLACLSISELYPINIANIYLIMIQRYNRARITNTLKYILKEINYNS